jgi:hypothetical protein
MYSVQQLTFDCLSYLKDFQAADAIWHTGAVGPDNPAKVCDEEYDVWLYRPALSLKAANTVAHLLIARFRISPVKPGVQLGRFVFLGRLGPSCSSVSRPDRVGGSLGSVGV